MVARVVRSTSLSDRARGPVLACLAGALGAGAWSSKADAIPPPPGPMQTIAPSYAVPSRLDPTASAELPLDTPVVSSLGRKQRHARAAFDGSRFLVVWDDDRSGTSEVWATRVALDGTALDPGGVRVAKGSWPSVAFDGARFVVAFAGGATVSVAHVGIDGSLLEPQPLPLAGTKGSVRDLTMATSPSGALLGWDTADGGYPRVEVVRLDPSGVALDAAPLVVATAKNGATGPSIGWNGSAYVVAYARSGDSDAPLKAAFRRVPQSGAPLDASDVVVASSDSLLAGPSLDCLGSECAFAWSDSAGLHANLVAADGTASPPHLLDASGACPCDVAATNDGYGVIHRRSGAMLRATFLDAAAAVTSAVDVAPTDSTVIWGHEPVIAAGAGLVLTLRTAQLPTTADDDVLGRRVELTGKLLDPVDLDLSIGANDQRNAVAAPAPGGGFVTVWEDRREGDADLWARRLDVAGNPDGPAFALTSEPSDEVLPSIATDGSGFVVAHSRDGSAVVTPLGADGAPIAPYDTTLANLVGEPAIAFDGGSYVVGWVSSSFSYSFLVQRVSSSGQPLDATPHPIAATDVGSPPRFACSAGTCAVVYRTDLFGGSILAVRFRGDGAVLDATPVPIASDSSEAPPTIAASGAGWLIAWSGPFSARGVNATWLPFAGPPSAAVPVGSPSEFIRSLAVTFDGARYVVVWNETFDDQTLLASFLEPAPAPATPALVLGVAGTPWQLSIAGDCSGHAVVAYDRFDDAVLAERARARVLSDDVVPAGGGCPPAPPADAGADAPNDGDAAADAQSEPDAPGPDAGQPDALELDAGEADGASEAPSGAAMGDPAGAAIADDAGCGCRTPRRGGSSALPALAFLAVLASVKRRRPPS